MCVVRGGVCGVHVDREGHRQNALIQFLCDEVKSGLPSCTYSAGPSIVAGIWAAVIDVGLAVGPIVASNTSTSVSTIAIVSASGPVLAGGVALTGEEVCTCVCTLILSLCCVCTLRQSRPEEFPGHSSSPHGWGGGQEGNREMLTNFAACS